MLFTGSRICNNVSICHFDSMYPSVVSSCGISPECVDYMDHGLLHSSPFDGLELHHITHTQSSILYYMYVLYGTKLFDTRPVNGVSTTSSSSHFNPIPIAWHLDHTFSGPQSLEYETIESMLTEWLPKDVRYMSLTPVRIQISPDDSPDNRPDLCHHSILHATVLMSEAIESGASESYQMLNMLKYIRLRSITGPDVATITSAFSLLSFGFR